MIAPLLLAAAQAMTFTADRIAADNVTKAMTATGHVNAAYGPVTLRGGRITRDADGKMVFSDPTCVTSCTNEVGHTHWNVTGEVEYQEHDHVILRNMWLRFCEVPVFWLPYLYYPLETDCGFSWMPGYTGRWGAYLLTKYTYHLAGDVHHRDNTWWLSAATRFDLRYRQGVALGEDLDWNLGDFGRGSFRAYYAWDQDAVDRYDTTFPGSEAWNFSNWGSDVDENRYAFEIEHRWEMSERDTLRLRGTVYSDSYFRADYFRRTFFNTKSQWLGYENSGIFWEHLENAFAFGAEISGRLNEFYGSTGRLPEIYFDVNPTPVFSLPVNYESQNRVGYLTRDPAQYGSGNRLSAYAFNPGPWAEYETFRFDTYHRLSAPFRTFDDVLSVVPRIGYHGTFWNQSGRDDLTGWGEAASAGHIFRSILEGGVTFAARGGGWVDDSWKHVVEPYFDVLAQKAWYSGDRDSNRPYVFDSIDASVMWEDQFAGRSRNLPYTYAGVTPGVRNDWSKLDEHGHLRSIVDLDVYAALQFEPTSYLGADDAHKLAEVGKPNYGRNEAYVSPGARLRWHPSEDLTLGLRGEYDSDRSTLAAADAGFTHKVNRDFSYYAKYAIRDYRWWDFSSAPFSASQMSSDDLNYVKCHYVQVGFTQQPIDWFAWSPYVRWDIRDNELDTVGAWFDYLTDCLGFRLIVEYDNKYTLLNGYEHEEDFTVGFYIYLRCFGPESSSIFMN